MEDIVPLFLFILFFRQIRSESVSFYFSVHENRALNTTSTLIRSTYVKDVMLCARTCGAEANCNTANYNPEENKCDLLKERMENVLPEAATIIERGNYLITKVSFFFPFVKQYYYKLKYITMLK